MQCSYEQVRVVDVQEMDALRPPPVSLSALARPSVVSKRALSSGPVFYNRPLYTKDIKQYPGRAGVYYANEPGY